MNTLGRHPIVEEDLRAIVSAPLPWKRFRGRSVLVTGASGLVASSLVEALLYSNEVLAGPLCTVVALVRDKARATARFAYYKSRKDLQFLVQDVSEPLPAGLTTNFIVHAAGNATPRAFGTDPVGTYRAAVLGTHHLLEHSHKYGCDGFLLLSSGAVHGTVSGDTTVIDETVYGSIDPLAPYACYAESKRMAETMCASWFRQFGIHTRIARLGHTYGPGLRRNDDRAFTQFVYSIVDGRDIELHSDGSAVRLYCYLTDAVIALLRILLNGRDGEAYLVANSSAACSVVDLARLLAGLFPEREVQVRAAVSTAVGSVANQDPFRQLDISKLCALGWSPHIDIATGFRRTLETLL